jgi:hypothetical protein
MAAEIQRLRDRASETEKITINLGYVDLGHISQPLLYSRCVILATPAPFELRAILGMRVAFGPHQKKPRSHRGAVPKPYMGQRQRAAFLLSGRSSPGHHHVASHGADVLQQPPPTYIANDLMCLSTGALV